MDSVIRELAENSFFILSLHPHHEGGISLVSQSKVGNKQTLFILSYLVAVNSRTSGKMVCDSQIVYDFGGKMACDSQCMILGVLSLCYSSKP